MTLPSFIENWRQRIDTMPLRQRALLATALLASVFLIVDALMIRPQEERRVAARQQLEEVDDRIAQLNTSIRKLVREAAADPDAELRERLARLTDQINAIEDELAALGGGLAKPEEALIMLRGLLDVRNGISLLSLEKLPAESLSVGERSDSSPAWIHRFRVVIDAPWSGALDYLKAVETLQTGIFLDTLTLETTRWPANRVELVFYTLTLNEGWLGV